MISAAFGQSVEGDTEDIVAQALGLAQDVVAHGVTHGSPRIADQHENRRSLSSPLSSPLASPLVSPVKTRVRAAKQSLDLQNEEMARLGCLPCLPIRRSGSSNQVAPEEESVQAPPSQKTPDNATYYSANEEEEEEMHDAVGISPGLAAPGPTPDSRKQQMEEDETSGDIMAYFAGDSIGKMLDNAMEDMLGGPEDPVHSATGKLLVHAEPLEETGYSPEDSARFQRLFGLRCEEQLVEHYSCAVEQSLSVLHTGRMFLSTNYICFHAAVLTPIFIIIPLRAIRSFTRTAHWLINPAIQVNLIRNFELDDSYHSHIDPAQRQPTCLDDGGCPVYKFASFWNMDAVLFKLEEGHSRTWQGALSLSSLTPRPTPDHPAPAGDLPPDSPTAPRELEGAGKADGGAPRSILQGKRSKLACVAERRLHGLSAEALLHRCFRDDTSFFPTFHSRLQNRHLDIGRWQGGDMASGVLRTVHYISPMSHPMCPPSSRVSETQRLIYSKAKKSIVWELIISSLDIPYGDKFVAQSRWEIVESEEGGGADPGDAPAGQPQPGCNVAVYYGAHFKGWCLFSSQIERGVVNESPGTVEVFFDTLEEKEDW